VTTTDSDWLTKALRRAPTTPAEQLAELEAERAAAVERVQDVDDRLDELVGRVRAAREEQDAQGAQAIRDSAGVRRPIVGRPSIAEQANGWLLTATGRVR
jgi:hypothetical protein